MVKLSSSVSVCGMVFFGTMCSLLAKLIYSVRAPSRFGGEAPFEKPWFQVLAMFTGMSFCIVLDLPGRRRRRAAAAAAAAAEPAAQPLLAPNGIAAAPAQDPLPAQSVWIIGLPTLLDLFATACGTTGLLYTTVSVYQMLRGAMLVWTAVLSIVFLQFRPSGYHWGGIGLCIVGIALVGAANIAAEGAGEARQNVALGVVIILAGQVLQAAQVVMEEFLLRDLRMSSVQIVAYEGLFGVAHCMLWVFPLVMLLPGADHGRLEDIADSFYMLFHSWKIAAIIALDMTMMLFYNVCGMEVTGNLSAVHRVVIETLRTLFVWVLDLMLYYVVSAGALGEQWTAWSFLQMAGFAFLIAGTAVYNYEAFAAHFAKPAPPAEKAAAPADADLPTTTVYEAVAAVAAAPPTTAPVRPVAVAVDTGYEEDEEEEDEDIAGSFLGQPVGSASHGSFLLAGTPSSYAGSGALSSSLRQRRAPSASTSPRN